MKRKSGRKSIKEYRNGIDEKEADNNEDTTVESDSDKTYSKKKKVEKQKVAGKKSLKSDHENDEGNEQKSELKVGSKANKTEASEEESLENSEPEEVDNKKRGSKNKKGKSKSKISTFVNDKTAALKKLKKKDGKEDSEEEEEEYEVEEVLDEKTTKGVHKYLIRWKGYGPDTDTWENEDTLNCEDLIKKYKESKGSTKSTKKSKSKKETNENSEDEKSLADGKSDDEGEVDWSSDDEFEVECILEVQAKRDGQRVFLVSWKGFPESQNSWEPEENLDCTQLIQNFLSKENGGGGEHVNLKGLRMKRTQTERFTVPNVGGRRSSRRLGRKGRVQYHDTE